MDAIQIILAIGGVIAGLIILYFTLVGVFAMLWARALKKGIKDLDSDFDEFPQPYKRRR